MHENENARNAKASKENILNCDASFPGLESRGTYLILVSARCCRAPSLPGIFPWTSPDITPPFVSLYGFLTSSDIAPASPLSNCGAHTSFWCQLDVFCTPSLPGMFPWTSPGIMPPIVDPAKLLTSELCGTGANSPVLRIQSGFEINDVATSLVAHAAFPQNMLIQMYPEQAI